MKTINIFKTTSFIIMMCLFSSSIISQNHKKQIQKIKIDENRESNEAVKIAFFTSKMQLTTIESQNFWPVVNEMEAELKALKDKNAQGKMMMKDKNTEEISDQELEDMMDARIQMGKEKVDILIKYHEKFKKVLPIQKLAKYYQSTKEFKLMQAKKKSNHQGMHK